jgi:hypothetical protein
MKTKWVVGTLGVLILAMQGCAPRLKPTAASVPPPPLAALSAGAPAMAAVCDESIWQHVYTGDPKKFSSPRDRLHVITPCLAVTGTVFNSKAEADGDFHIRITLDSQFKSLLNAKNASGQSGHLVVEPVCMAPVNQKDTKKEGVCNGFHQAVFDPSMNGKHVRIVGAYVTDMEHGWNEIHPVTSITVIP